MILQTCSFEVLKELVKVFLLDLEMARIIGKHSSSHPFKFYVNHRSDEVRVHIALSLVVHFPAGEDCIRFAEGSSHDFL